MAAQAGVASALPALPAPAPRPHRPPPAPSRAAPGLNWQAQRRARRARRAPRGSPGRGGNAGPEVAQELPALLSPFLAPWREWQRGGEVLENQFPLLSGTPPDGREAGAAGWRGTGLRPPLPTPRAPGSSCTSDHPRAPGSSCTGPSPADARGGQLVLVPGYFAESGSRPERRSASAPPGLQCP